VSLYWMGLNQLPPETNSERKKAGDPQ